MTEAKIKRWKSFWQIINYFILRFNVKVEDKKVMTRTRYWLTNFGTWHVVSNDVSTYQTWNARVKRWTVYNPDKILTLEIQFWPWDHCPYLVFFYIQIYVYNGRKLSVGVIRVFNLYMLNWTILIHFVFSLCFHVGKKSYFGQLTILSLSSSYLVHWKSSEATLTDLHFMRIFFRENILGNAPAFALKYHLLRLFWGQILTGLLVDES